MIKTVVFDLHGTIIEYNIDFKSARAEARGFLISQGITESIFSFDDSYFEMLKKVELYIKTNHIDPKEYLRLRKGVFDILEKYEMEGAETTHLIPGILETLKALKKMRIKLGILTVNSQKSTDHILSAFRLNPFFQSVITRDFVPAVKPNPIHLETLLKSLKAKPGETILVGDSISDIKAAKKLHVFAVGTSTGFTKAEELTKAGADYVISTPIDLITLTKKLSQKHRKSN